MSASISRQQVSGAVSTGRISDYPSLCPPHAAAERSHLRDTDNWRIFKEIAASFLAFCHNRAARSAIYERIFTEIAFRSQRVNHREGTARGGSCFYLQSGVIELRRSLVPIRAAQPWRVLLNCVIQFEHMLFRGYFPKIPTISAYNGAVAAFLQDRDMNLSIFTLNHVFSRNIEAFRGSGHGFCSPVWLLSRAPHRARTYPKYSRGKCDQSLARQHERCVPSGSMTPVGA